MPFFNAEKYIEEAIEALRPNSNGSYITSGYSEIGSAYLDKSQYITGDVQVRLKVSYSYDTGGTGYQSPTRYNILSETIKPEAIIKNNRGVVLMTEYMSNVDSLKLAMHYFDEAIAIDSSYVLAYVNKAEVFNRMNESQKSINLLIFATHKLSDDLFLPLLLGQHYEHLEKKDSAQYKRLAMMYNNLIQIV